MVFSVKREMLFIAFFITNTAVYALPSDYILNLNQENLLPKVKGAVNFASITKSKTNQVITLDYSICDYSTAEDVACRYSSTQIAPYESYDVSIKGTVISSGVKYYQKFIFHE